MLYSVDKFLTLMIDHLRKKITSSSGPNAIVDLANVSLYFTMDIITRLSFGKELGFLASDSDRHNVLSDTRSAVKVMWLPLVDSTVRRITSSRAFLDLVGKKSVLGVIRRYVKSFSRSPEKDTNVNYQYLRRRRQESVSTGSTG